MASADLLLLLVVALAATSAAADSIHGCGGFVQASPALIKVRKASDAKLDYSHVTVELRTIDGLLKDRTQCAPNGYYFIPVYDKGSFIVKVRGPDGWSWEPENVAVVINDNGCNANADINFQFTGFMISGKVKGAVGGESCSLKDGGPPDVKVELLSPSGDLLSSVVTSETGDYTFTNINPGEYKLRASHPSIEIETRGSSEVNLGFGNALIDDIFFVSGYDIRGFVVSQGNPILGVHMYLFSDDVSGIYCPQGSGKSPRQKNALCHAISDADGRFTFKSVPCGLYELLPYYKGENTVFDVSPPSLNISVEHHHTDVSQKFQVTGFSVGGRVIGDNGAGVDGVKITVDGQLRAITDAQGYYKLDQVNSKHYSVVAEKDHYKFSNLNNFLVLPNMASIGDIRAISYDVCGIVRLINTNYKAKVSLTHGPANVKPQIKQIDDSGKFCFEVPPGEYRLSALAMKSESSSLLFFSPPYIDITVDKPLFNVEFLQAQVNIHGTVSCKDKCSPSILVSLLRSDGMDTDERTISLCHDSCDFIFPKVFPGKYQLQVKHESPGSADDNWCWHQHTVDLDVGVEDKRGIVFVQKGYWITVNSTHDVDAYIHQPDASPRNLKIKRGLQRICLEYPGLHELHFVNSCIFFGGSSVKFDTLNPLPIHLTGTKYLLRGEIHVITSLDLDGLKLSEHIVVDVLNKGRDLIDNIQTKYLSFESGETDKAVLEYSIWADLGEELIFVPRDSRNDGGKIMLFYPREHHVSVLGVGCQATILPIVGRSGLYIEGSMSPALSGVDIKIIAAADSRNAPLLKGESALKTKTGADGSFVAGPLYDDTTYVIEASKPGYHLKPVGPNIFSCQKLSQILVNIYDREETEELFPSVLLSLSGEDGYRNNSITGSGGQFVFNNLFPGSFYLRPLLKEYSFSPPALAVELGSGESKDAIFYATRVAYSAMGTISLLSGQPKDGIHIEARSDSKGHYEETTSDYLGNYRLRGLIPNTKYIIRVVVKEDSNSLGIERASPESFTIQVGSEDITGLDFVVFEHPDTTMLSGHVVGTNLEALQPHLSVEVRLASDPTKIESAIPLPLSYFFQIRDLPKGKHLVQLVLHSSSITHRFQSEILEVDLEMQPQVHVGPLAYKVGEYHQKQELTPAPVFPLIMGVSVIALFISMPRLKDLSQWAVGMTRLGSAAAMSKKDQRKPVLKRRLS
uniref:Nodal modulator 1 n=1 Tax=Anthurium amnicola TaxID=1678845 RepID=A0A1D1Y1N7_9ARAE